MYFNDSHCHLTHENIHEAGTPEELVSKANHNNVRGVLTISCRIADEFGMIRDTIQGLENVWCSVGTHPHDASREEEKKITASEIVDLANGNDKVIGIGESGLDYHYDFSDRKDQQESFRKHIRACLETGLPLIVHAREADEDIMRIIREEGAGDKRLKGVLHCFSSGRAMAMEAVERGFYISFSGMVTFKKSDELRSIAKDIPLDRLLIETDDPYLAPVPYRGKTNQPAYVVHTAEHIAMLHDIPIEEIGTITTRNFFNLFDKAQKTWQPAQQ